MNSTDERKLKFDRRLHARRGWVSDAELQAELDSLPDVSHKIAAPEEGEAAGESAQQPSAAEGAESEATARETRSVGFVPPE